MPVLRLFLLLALCAMPARADNASDLFLALKSAPNAAEAQLLVDEIWRYWLKGPNAEATALVESARKRGRSYDFAGALEILDKAVAAAPEWAEALNQRAIIHFMRQDFDKSLADIDKALELEPRHFGALSGKARILTMQGRVTLAQIALRRAIAINPFLKERFLLIKPPGQEL